MDNLERQSAGNTKTDRPSTDLEDIRNTLGNLNERTQTASDRLENVLERLGKSLPSEKGTGDQKAVQEVPSGTIGTIKEVIRSTSRYMDEIEASLCQLETVV